MVVVKGSAIVKMGAASNNYETISNLKRVYWKRLPERHTPQTVMNTVNPVGWNKPHKYVVGFMDLLSEAYNAFYYNGSGHVAYVVEDGDNVEVPYFVVETKSDEATPKTWIDTLTGVIIDSIEEPVIDGDDKVIRVYFSAKKVVTTKPS
jgi:hypothetical protein